MRRRTGRSPAAGWRDRCAGPPLHTANTDRGEKLMKYMIASDIHGSAYYCEKMLEALEKEKADRLVLLGDLLYHGPRNDLPREYAPKKVIAMLNAQKGPDLQRQRQL